MSTLTNRLLDVTQTLPETLLAEVVDFAEFLQSRRSLASNHPQDKSLHQLSGGLEKSTVFAGAPADIQRKLRDEWH
ncbi:MAG: hypothetical protein CFE39_15105 [Comamonadaceae bacterium PBBC2]|nr:MAG: hypothetical protein CFE39_15105 [Comamonadaceae bacterium PBBC2]